MITSLTLPLHFDPVRLRADLALVRDDEWLPHFNENDYGGQWRGAALRSLGGAANQLASPPGAPVETFADTDLLRRCPYFREVLAAFPCPLKTVRLLSLAPGSFVREHRDRDLNVEHGEMRIHVPVRTSQDIESGVEFYLGGERLHLEEGCCYYLNVGRPHRVRNRSSDDRVHLIIDIAVNEWAGNLVKQGLEVARLPPRPRGFEDFRSRVLCDNSLAEKLHAAPDLATLQRDAVALGRQLGCDFEPHEIGCCMSAGEARDWDLCGWAPVAARIHDGEAMADWVYFGQRRFTEPFFEESVRLALGNPFAKLFRLEAGVRRPQRAGRAGLEPAGFIFHMSRCGSTLVTRALAALPRVVAISEAAPIHAMIRTGRSAHVRDIVLALGRPRVGGENRYFIKFDAWEIHQLPLIREAFPDTPWIFVYRDPLEVLMSQLRTPGMHCLPGALDPATLGMTFADITLRREEWCARVLARFLRSALDHRADPAGMFVDYRDLPKAIWEGIAKHFSTEFDEEELRQMRETVQFHAKLPELRFAPDSDDKQREASPEVRAIATELLEPLYRELRRVSEQ
jgi:hypothetical protein